MHPVFEDFLTRQRAARFADFSGAVATVRVPLRDHVINTLVKSAIAGQPRIEDLRIHTHPGNRLEIQATVSGIPLVRQLTLEFLLHPHILFEPTPKVRLNLQRTGAASLLLGFALPMFTNALPPEATWEGDGLSVDLGVALRRRGFEELVPLIKSGQFSSEESCLWIDLTVQR